MASNEIKDTNTVADQMPDISKWVKVCTKHTRIFKSPRRSNL